ncbi:hypothetical protein M3Y99_01211300 [Aphelenchoides fujianensis]|nr:hypothetical protein M3Y99_01211300 [Aphelenchoides fujianensis]
MPDDSNAGCVADGSWESLWGGNTRQPKIINVILFLLILVVFFVNVQIWTQPLTRINATNVTNATAFNKQGYPSPTLLFYGERDAWEDSFFYSLLLLLILLSAFAGLCFHCLLLMIPLAAYAGLFVFSSPFLFLAALAKLVHVWKNPEEMGDEWDLRLSELISTCYPIVGGLLGGMVSAMSRGQKKDKAKATVTDQQLLK